MGHRSTTPAVIDPDAYADRLIPILFPGEPVTDRRRESAAAIIAEAVLAAHGRISIWKICPICKTPFRAGGWPLPGHERNDQIYDKPKCRHIAKVRRYRLRHGRRRKKVA